MARSKLMEAHNVDKKEWVPPKLIVHGSIDIITREHPIRGKFPGSADGVVVAARDISFS